MGTPDIQSKHIVVVKRTWRDAACEIAYIRAKQKRANAVDIKSFLKGHGGCIWCDISSSPKKHFSNIADANNFITFKKDFMEWLFKNEVKK